PFDHACPHAMPTRSLHDALPIFRARHPDRLTASKGSELTLASDDAFIAAFLAEFGTRITALKVEVPSLETVFLSLTGRELRDQADRKSTRLNSSHVKSSYAVFCL